MSGTVGGTMGMREIKTERHPVDHTFGITLTECMLFLIFFGCWLVFDEFLKTPSRIDVRY